MSTGLRGALGAGSKEEDAAKLKSMEPDVENLKGWFRDKIGNTWARASFDQADNEQAIERRR